MSELTQERLEMLDDWKDVRNEDDPEAFGRHDAERTLHLIERPKEIDGLPVAEFGFPGTLRDQLVAAILRGAKTATASLRAEYGVDELPQVGRRSVVVDSQHTPVAVIETTEVHLVPAGKVDEQFARDEGEGFESVADWRAAHERFWGLTPEREGAGQPAFTIEDETVVVCERFRVVKRLG